MASVGRRQLLPTRPPLSLLLGFVPTAPGRWEISLLAPFLLNSPCSACTRSTLCWCVIRLHLLSLPQMAPLIAGVKDLQGGRDSREPRLEWGSSVSGV